MGKRVCVYFKDEIIEKAKELELNVSKICNKAIKKEIEILNSFKREPYRSILNK